MKKFGLYITTLALAMGSMLTSCNDDKEEYQILELPTQSTLATDVSSVIITNDNLGSTVCTLTYSAGNNEIKSTDGTSLGTGAYWIQYSLDQSFATYDNKSVTPQPGNNTYSFTGLDLNTSAVKVGAEYDVATDVYFRIVHSYNENSMEMGVASNVVTINVTPMEVPMISVVSKTDIDVIYATLQFNAETGRFEGTYPDLEKKEKKIWNNDWNFYFVDTKGVVYGCDDDWTAGNDGVGRSCKLVAGREVGDDYSHWFDPTATGEKGITFWVDLSIMEWGFINNNTDEPNEPSEELEKNQLGIRGNGDWENTSNLVAPTVSGSTYTYVIEDIIIENEFKFYYNGEWIGVKEIETLGTEFSGTDNLSLTPGTYTLTIVITTDDDGSFTFNSVTAEKTAAAEKKDLTDVELGIKGNGDWNNLQNAVKPTKDGDVYTFIISNVVISDEFKFVYGENWLGVGDFKSEEGISGPNNIVLTAGTYNFTIVLTAKDNGDVENTSVVAELVED